MIKGRVVDEAVGVFSVTVTLPDYSNEYPLDNNDDNEMVILIIIVMMMIYHLHFCHFK
jgi:hypothetical protein